MRSIPVYGNKLLCFTCGWFLLGMIVHYLFKDQFVREVWNKVFYLWDKTLLLLLFILPLKPAQNPSTEVRFTLYLIQAFCVIRIIWDVFAIEDYKLASEDRVIDILFSINLVIIICIWFYPLVRYVWYHKMQVYSKIKSVLTRFYGD